MLGRRVRRAPSQALPAGAAAVLAPGDVAADNGPAVVVAMLGYEPNR